jgi:hypothetical protein
MYYDNPEEIFGRRKRTVCIRLNSVLNFLCPWVGCISTIERVPIRKIPTKCQQMEDLDTWPKLWVMDLRATAEFVASKEFGVVIEC